ncbi:hypothetical protein FDI40_gp013 [Agrobacterium phage Atu_ph07]|uniref:Uncharacterized protein n=1 Tax=Agrobacterium phage Atu_ph07 TaxID=2024264 RepID=A0A2L0UZ58_9CAUD|nr:hypothetical protein FDI40_gp013 [Agrobacterium phage Atu_ph07]AUZ94825.1 hypothetical protein [Agrobacterium phage Atu_ph07]
MKITTALSQYAKETGSSVVENEFTKDSLAELNQLVLRRNQEINDAIETIRKKYDPEIIELEESIALMVSMRLAK